MRIMHVVTTSVINGVGRHVLDLAVQQREHGATVVVVTGEHGYLFSACKERGISISVVAGLRDHSIDPADFEAGFLSELTHSKPDLVHFHQRVAGVKGMPVARWFGAKLVYTHHVVNYDYCIGLQSVTSEQVPVITVTEVGAKFLRNSSSMPLQVTHIPNGISRPKESGVRLQGVNGRKSIVYPAYIHREKGIDLAVLAMRLLKDRMGETAPVLNVVGEGPDEENMRELVKQLGLDGLVEFLGVIPDILHPGLNAAALVLPSRVDACPLSVLEAMSCRIPVVAAKVGGIPELIPDSGHGVLVTPDSPESLAAGIESVLFDEEGARRRAERSFERYQGKHTAELMARRTFEVYEEVLGSQAFE
ncbi:glycosyltransferase family 4 protein [Streptomyces sp. NPDC056831]|uniref:glycosyltransferase family 4 protein n=1 Tax=Streptomyces sp. NPDC056831 TaxID=3345954 RepID=UPI003696C0C3